MAVSRIADFKDGIQLLPIYNGTNKSQLNTFITSVEEFMVFVNAANPPLSAFEKTIIKNGILGRIKGEAIELLANTDRSDWNKIKNTLKSQFIISKNYTTVFHEILHLSTRDPFELFKIVNNKFKEMKDLIEFQYPTDDHIIEAFEKVVIYEFIGKISEPFASNIANRQPGNLAELGNLLTNDYNFLKSRKTSFPPKQPSFKPLERQLPNIPPRTFPKPEFRPKPVKTNFNAATRNFAPQQNFSNFLQNRQVNPTPMSTSTRFSHKPNFNTFQRQNQHFKMPSTSNIPEQMEINMQDTNYEEQYDYDHNNSEFENYENENTESENEHFLDLGEGTTNSPEN